MAAGFSAKAVADSWFRVNDMPRSIRAVLDQSPELAGAQLIDAWLERCTALPFGYGAPSQADVFAVLAIGSELAALAVEAKVSESFGPLVSEWLVDGEKRNADGGKNRRERITGLRHLLGFESQAQVGDLRYQLFHRIAASILEARRYRTDKAVMLVQSFCDQATGLSDYVMFCERMGMAGLARTS